MTSIEENPSRYEGGLKSDLKKGLRTFQRPLDFAGRSSRTEFLAFWIIAHVLTALLSASMIYVLGEERFGGGQTAIVLLVMLPLPALMARRLHDMGVTGWIALPVIAALIFMSTAGWIYDFETNEVPVNLAALADKLGSWVYGLSVAHAALIATFLVPPRESASQYGPDPRL